MEKELLDQLIEQLVGKTIVDATRYVENSDANVNGSQVGGEGVTFILDDGSRIDIGVDFYAPEFYVREVE